MRTTKLAALAIVLAASCLPMQAQADRIYYMANGHRYWCPIDSKCGQVLIQQEQERAKAAQPTAMQRILGITPTPPPPRFEVVAGPGQSAPPTATIAAASPAPTAAPAASTQVAALPQDPTSAARQPVEQRQSRSRRGGDADVLAPLPPPRRVVERTPDPVVLTTGSISGVLPEAAVAAFEAGFDAEKWENFNLREVTAEAAFAVGAARAQRSRHSSFHEAVAMGKGTAPSRLDACLFELPARTPWPLNGVVGAQRWEM